MPGACAKSFGFDADFQVESYLRYQGKKFVDRFDANSFLYITKAGDYYDMEKLYGEGSAVNAFSKAKAKFLVVSFTSDWLYPPKGNQEVVQSLLRLGKDATYAELAMDFGHDSFLVHLKRCHLPSVESSVSLQAAWRQNT